MDRGALGDELKFRLLGPFEVWLGDRQLEIGPPKQRALLAALLLEVGRPLLAEDLGDAIWGKAQPGHPRKAVQTYVTRLRQYFEELRLGAVIHSAPDGYSIDLRPEQVDVWRFRQHLERASRMAEGGDLDGEADALADAVAEWRGEPLDGLPSELLRREIAPRLREQWLQAMDRRFNLELGRGRHEQLIGEWFTVTARYPRRESSWIQLMTALHRSGRRSEALDAYHSARHHLATELGVDPGPVLQDLYTKALVGNVTATVGRAVAMPLVPRQLPAKVSAFVGRTAELARLDALLDDLHRPVSPTRVCVIAGMAGIGKTAMAIHWTRRVLDHFPDGQLWVNLRGFGQGQDVTPPQALAGFLRALGVQDSGIPLELDDRVSLYRSLVDGRRMLIVLDGASDADQVRPLVPGSPGCLVIVTSRSRLSGLVATEAAHSIVLTVLDRHEARSLLRSRLGGDRIRSQALATDDVIRSCAGLPLALVFVATKAATHPELGLHSLAAELREARGSPDRVAVEDRAVEVRAVFSSSYRALSAPDAQLFRMLGLHPGPDVTVRALASLAGISVSRARSRLAELCNASLINEHEPGRYVFHHLLRVYAGELGRLHDAPADREAARLRMFDHYLHTAYAGSVLLQAWESVPPPPHQSMVVPEDLKDHRQALSWFAAEHHVLLSMVRHAAEIGHGGYSQQLAWTLTEYLYRQGHWHDLAHTLQVALDTIATPAEPHAQARLHRGLVAAYARMGRPDLAETHGLLIMDLAERLGDKAGLAMGHRTMAGLREAQGRFAAALDHDLQALLLFQTVGDRRGEACTLNSVGSSYARLADHLTALDYCERALALMTDLGDRRGLAATWDSLGYAHLHLGHIEMAIACHRRAATLFQDAGDRYQEADCLVHLGDAYEASANLEAAREVRRAALRTFVALGHHDAGPLRDKL